MYQVRIISEIKNVSRVEDFITLKDGINYCYLTMDENDMQYPCYSDVIENHFLNGSKDFEFDFERDQLGDIRGIEINKM